MIDSYEKKMASTAAVIEKQKRRNSTQIKDDKNGSSLIKNFLPQSTSAAADAQRRSATADAKSADF